MSVLHVEASGLSMVFNSINYVAGSCRTALRLTAQHSLNGCMFASVAGTQYLPSWLCKILEKPLLVRDSCN